MGSLLQDLRFALRMLRQSPGFTAVAILTLAVGIGASESRAFEAMAAYYSEDFNLTGTTEPERLGGLRITPGLFALPGVRPIFGREFNTSDGQYVALLSYRLWQGRFGGNASIVGKAIYLGDQAYTVTGILPARLYFPPREYQGELTAQIFVPALPNVDRGSDYLRVIGRLAPGISQQRAQVEMDGIAARLSPSDTADLGEVTKIGLDSLNGVAASGMRETAWALLGAAAFVLLIACANIASLLFARGAVREQEMAIRRIAGASMARIMRQLLTEGLLLAVFGGALGVAIADRLMPLLATMVPENTMFFTRIHDVGLQLNHTVLAFATLSAVVSVLLFGFLPAWKAATPAQMPYRTRRTDKTHAALIVLEVSLGVVLLAGAGLMMSTLARLSRIDVGFSTRQLLTVRISLPAKKYDSGAKQTTFFNQVLERVRLLPSVLSEAAITDLPLSREWSRSGLQIAGVHRRQGTAACLAVSPEYFHTMGIPLLRGRQIIDSDSAGSPLVGVISLHMAREYWPHQNPIGATITVRRAVPTPTSNGVGVRAKEQELEIVGIAGDVHQWGLETPAASEIYMPYPQWPSDEMSLIVHTASEPSLLIPSVEKAVWTVDADQPVTAIRTMSQWVAREEAARRFVLELTGAFALIAVLLATIGIYGVISYSVAQRTHEIGIRVALGAQKGDVLRMVLGQGLGLALIGVATGLVGALGLTRFLSSLLYGVKPTDPFTFLAASVIMSAFALLACYIPARRAVGVDPMVALRHE